MLTISRDNVNYCLPVAMMHISSSGVLRESRGMKMIEYPSAVCTTYHKPLERVLYEPLRDNNPYFSVMESLWILGGRNDVAFPSQFNKNLANFSDDGVLFHGAYGHRLRSCGIDQLKGAIQRLKTEPDTRQCVLQIWDKGKDFNVKTKDIPCNDLIFLKIRDNKLDITVCCRSNDVIWGCMGANVVQFSYLQEYIAGMVGCEIGVYNQISDSFHVYPDNPLWDKLKDLPMRVYDPYDTGEVAPFNLVDEPKTFDSELNLFLDGELDVNIGWDNLFFPQVAIPMRLSWLAHKETKTGWVYLESIKATDLRLACEQWLARRGDKP